MRYDLTYQSGRSDALIVGIQARHCFNQDPTRLDCSISLDAESESTLKRIYHIFQRRGSDSELGYTRTRV